jgi:hypothetical protein
MMSRAVKLVGSVWALSGCSVTLQHSPPSGATAERFHPCDEGRTWPVVDTILAAAAGFNMVMCAAQDPCEQESGAGKSGALIGLGAVAAIFSYSAVSGVRSASRCRRLHRDYVPPPAPPPLAPPRPKSPGTEGADCGAGGRCDPGLTCASNLCVRAR